LPTSRPRTFSWFSKKDEREREFDIEDEARKKGLSMGGSPVLTDDAESLASEFASILWRARIVILAGAAAAAAFAFVSTQRPQPTYEAETLLLRTDADAPQSMQATVSLAPSSNQNGLQLTVPAAPVRTLAPLDLPTIEYLIKGPGGVSGIARQLGEDLARNGLTAGTLADRITILGVPDTKLVAVRVIMPSEALAVKAADAVAGALIEQDEVTIARATKAALQQIVSELKSLRSAMETKEHTPSAEAIPDDLDDSRMMKLMLAGLMGRYRQAVVESAADYVRLRVVQPAVATERTPGFPRWRNAIVGLVAGALLAAIAAVGVYYWRPTDRRRVRI
jgi:uncharacterized protein involved in exopolysaccharide biosynthesis